MKLRQLFRVSIFCPIAALLVVPMALAEDGVSADKILLGQPAPLSGPASALGLGMKLGMQAAFDEFNAAGGANGRKIELVSVDDGYEPEKSVAAVKELIESKKVFALVGPVGTPTTQATQPIATEKNIPFVGAFTGAGFLRDPKLTNVINLRASYGQETETWVKEAVDVLKLEKVAILYQDDGFGRAGLDGVKAAMAKRGKTLVAEGTFQRNTTAVKTALLEIRKAEPQAVFMVGPYAPMAEFIKLSRQIKFEPLFFNISFVGSNALADALGENGKGVVVTQVVPLPTDPATPVVKDYIAALAKTDAASKPGFVSLEGYLVGRLVVDAIKKAGPDLTRTAFLDAIYKTGKFDLGGVALEYGAGDNQGSATVYLTKIGDGGTFSQVNSLQ